MTWPRDEMLQSGPGFSTEVLRDCLPVTGRGVRRSTSTARLASHIRQLCVLGVDSYTLMPVLIENVKRLVGADTGSFWWADDDYRIANVYLEPEFSSLAATLSRYENAQDEFSRLNHEAHGLDFASAMQCGRGWGNTARHEAIFLRSREFEFFWYPTRCRHGLELTAVQHGRGWGSIMVTRPEGAQPFDARTEAALAPLSAFLAHAVRSPASARRFASKATESGVVVSDRTGRILWHSALGARLLQQAAPQTMSFTLAAKSLPNHLRPLIARLLHADAEEMRAPPAMHHRTHWGKFTLRAYPLLNMDPDLRSATCFAIHIERHEPIVLRVTRGAHSLGLSKRQVDICAHLAEGTSYPDIAQKIGVRPTTVIDQVRKMYMRLDVHDRPGLLHTLSAAALAYEGESGRSRPAF